MFDPFIKFVREIYKTKEFIPLHAPVFKGNEKKYLLQCIDSSYVSSVGEFVNRFETEVAKKHKVKYAIATTNGTSALHTCLLLSEVKTNDEVLTQPLTFVATCNAISYCQAYPNFIDVSLTTLGMCPKSLLQFLEQNTYEKNGSCYNRETHRRIKACVPMHTFGHPCEIDKIKEICSHYNLTLIEDAAESIGSTYKGRPLGSFGDLSALSFNGNKIITAGGGGAVITNNEEFAKKGRHITTTAKRPHKWKYDHDAIGYNYRMPNINAALLCAQLEQLDHFIEEKRKTAQLYKIFFKSCNYGKFISEPPNSFSNYWLNAIQMKTEKDRDHFLAMTNEQGIMTRPVWTLMNRLEMFKKGYYASLKNAELLEQLIINIPSSVRF